MQKGFIERFNGSFRRGVLDMHVFRNLGEVYEQAEQWLTDYNTGMPHDSLGGLTPAEFCQYHEPEPANQRGIELREFDTASHVSMA